MKFLRIVKMAIRARSLSWFIAEISNKRRLVYVKIRGVGLHVRTKSPDLKTALSCLRGEFDPVFRAIPDCRVVVDAGGYIGTAAIAFAIRYPQTKVITIEPDAENFAVLKRNVAAWKNIVPLNKALATELGEKMLFDRGTGEWGFSLIEDAADRQTAPRLTVDCISLEELMQDSPIDILKMDIEGAELAILEQNSDLLREIRCICIELHDRITPGCTAAWMKATADRGYSKMGSEKYMSLAA